MKKYVVGFITDGKRIALINKNRPSWQKGLFNGIGGKIEKDETSGFAIKRKCIEETGLVLEDWILLDSVKTGDYLLDYYYIKIEPSILDNIESGKDEIVKLFNLKDLPRNIVKDVPYYTLEIRVNIGPSNNEVIL